MPRSASGIWLRSGSATAEVRSPTESCAAHACWDTGWVPVRPPVVAVVGPTAAGKSDLAVELASRLPGEVVNADSMQVYRGMDIGTAKPTPVERRGIRHHVLDVLDVAEPATVAEFQSLARAAIDDCLGRACCRWSWGECVVRARGARPVRVPGDRPGAAGPARARLGGRGCTRAARAAHQRRPRRCGGDPADQRPAHRSRAGGRRADRPPLFGNSSQPDLPV